MKKPAACLRSGPLGWDPQGWGGLSGVLVLLVPVHVQVTHSYAPVGGGAVRNGACPDQHYNDPVHGDSRGCCNFKLN